MVQEDLIKDFCARLQDKNILIKDLCARLPYDTMIHGIYAYQNLDFDTESDYIEYKEMDNVLTVSDIEWIQMCAAEVKPYLFPLSSMTEEQKNECFNGTPLGIDKYGDVAVKDDFFGNSLYTDLEIYLEVIDWLLKNHFDIYGLIDKNLAIDATNLNIY